MIEELTLANEYCKLAIGKLAMSSIGNWRIGGF